MDPVQSPLPPSTPSSSLSVTPADQQTSQLIHSLTSMSSYDPMSITSCWKGVGGFNNPLSNGKPQDVAVTHNYIRMLMHWSAAPLTQKLIHEYQNQMVPSLKRSQMLRASAKLFHQRYVLLHQDEHKSRLSAASQESERQLDLELQYWEAREAHLDDGPGSNSTDEASLAYHVEQMLSQALRQASPVYQFKEILGTLLNVAGHHHLCLGNEAYYATFDRARDFITHSQTRPVALDLYALSGLDFRPANAWVLADVSSAVCRGTSLHCRYIASNATSDPYEDYHGLEWISRCDDRLFAALADTAALARQLKWQAPKSESELLQAQSILHVINTTAQKEGGQTDDKMFTLLLNELWRQGIRIYFHQATFQRGQLFPDIRQAHEAMLNLINYSESFQDHLPPAVALPLFLGASASLETSQRAQWVKVLRGLGQHRGYADNLLVIEEVWKGVDASGRTVDWLELVRQGVVEPPAFP